MDDAVVIMVNHNHREQACAAVESLYALPDRAIFSLVAVDNTGSDGFAGWLARRFPQARLIRNAQPRGFAQNNNEAIRLGPESRYVLLMNPDVILRAGMLDLLIAFMDANSDVGIAAPMLRNPDGTRQPSARGFSTPGVLAARALRLDGILRKTSFMRRYLLADCVNEPTNIDWVTAAVMIVRRSAVADVGAMDERYFLYSEDQDWCCRMWRAGWRVCYVPQAEATHAHQRRGVRKPFSKAAFHQVRSALVMFRKFRWRLSRF